MRRLLALLTWMLAAHVSAALEPLVEQMAAGARLPEGLLERAVVSSTAELSVQASPAELFLQGWLLEQGVYGVAADNDTATALFQRAAEQGSLAAVAHCWTRCVELNAAVREQLDRGVVAGDAEAAYLNYRFEREQGGAVQRLDQLLLQAARGGQARAIGELYAHHFLQWAGGQHSLDEALKKLQRCRAEGVVYCYYLSGALQQRQGNSAEALLYFQQLQWIDPVLFARHLDSADLLRLQQRLPQQNAEPIRTRAAILLSTQPAVGNPRIDRFALCATARGVGCVEQLAARDARCLPEVLEQHPAFEGFRHSRGYQRCLQRAF